MALALPCYFYMTILLGADIASRHGAIVDSNGALLYGFHDGNGMDSTQEDMWQRARLAAGYVPMRSNVAVDWDVNIGSFGSSTPGKKRPFNNPKVGVILTVQVMFFVAFCRLERKAHVQFITPAELRKRLNLPVKMSKEAVHAAMWDKLPVHLTTGKAHSRAEVREDMIDGYLLTLAYRG